jgi:histidinol dehydrogenase
MLRWVEWSPVKRQVQVEAFLQREAFDAQAERVAANVLSAIRKDGDRAIERFVRSFDGVNLKASAFRVTKQELDDSEQQVSPAFRRAVAQTLTRVTRFAKAGLRRDWRIPTPRGGWLGERFVALDRVGVYVPGGAAPLASTALMTIPLARAAGVREVVACTPCGRDGLVNPYLLYAMKNAGATEVYRLGGIQAVGAMAFGTGSIRRVQKIVGPGGAYVTAAKRQVYGHVALDLVAGPSEIAVLADDSADPAHVAADLLSQVEHGTGWERALLVTSSRRVAAAACREVERQVATLSRRKVVERCLVRGVRVVVVRGLDDGVELCNRFAPEHLELIVRNPGRWMKKVRRAGAVFLGPWSPEPAGDFVAGPSHVLPTGGAAAMFSGLTVEDFRRRMSVVAFSRADLRETLPAIETFAEVEGLDAHGRSARVRFEVV